MQTKVEEVNYDILTYWRLRRKYEFLWRHKFRTWCQFCCCWHNQRKRVCKRAVADKQEIADREFGEMHENRDRMLGELLQLSKPVSSVTDILNSFLEWYRRLQTSKDTPHNFKIQGWNIIFFQTSVTSFMNREYTLHPDTFSFTWTCR